MRVMVMIRATKSSETGELPSTELLAAMGKYCEELANAGIMLAGEGLQPSSKGVRVHFSGTNRTVTDGPFTETKELIAGFWLWKVRSMAEAIEWIKRCPNPMIEDSEIEIRPLFEADDFGEAFTPDLREQEAALRARTLGLGTPTFQAGPELLVAGLKESYTTETVRNIPQLWQQFAAHMGKIPGQIGADSYGVCWNTDDNCNFDYLAAVPVTSEDSLPAGFQTMHIPARRYAVFTHPGHVSALSTTIDGIWSKWAPDCGLRLAHSAPCFEKYTSEFNPKTGLGGMELWVPLETETRP